MLNSVLESNIEETDLRDLDKDTTDEIDMTDPAVKAAATKIQSVFKGFKTRKTMLQEHGYKCG